MSARIQDRNGWFEIKANPLSKAGVFAYKGASIKAPDPGAMYNVYRPATELADPETINSFRLLPFIIKHMMLGDPEQLNEQVIPAEIKGVHGVIGDTVFFDPADNTLKGNLKVFSSTMPKLLAAGTVDLSLGYRCVYVAEVGVAPCGTPYQYVQRRMRGNHVALVEDGRCGDEVSVMDEVVTFDMKDAEPMAERLKKRNLKAHTALVKLVAGAFARHAAAKYPKAKIAVEGFAMDAADDEAVASEPSLSDVADILADVLPAIADINASISGAGATADPMDDMEPEMDAAGVPVMDADGKPKMKKKAPAAAAAPAPAVAAPAADAASGAAATGMDAAEVAKLRNRVAELERNTPAAILAEIGKRDRLAADVSKFVGTFDHSEMTLAGVAKYAVAKLEIPTMDGAEVASVTAWLHGRKVPQTTHGVALDGAEPGGKNPLSAYLAGK